MTLSTTTDLGQVRSPTHIYRCKVTPDEQLVLKIYNVKRERLYKGTYTLQELKLPSLQKLSTTKEALDILLSSDKFPKEYLLPVPTLPTLEECQTLLQRIIGTLKTIIEPKESQFKCSITTDTFQDPVMTNCGHTFEKTAIEAWRSHNNECPTCRNTITSLTPNFEIKKAIDASNQQDPIPTLKLFQRENPRLAATSIASMQTQIEEQEYQEALNSFKTALQYTKSWHDYRHLPSLYKQINDPARAQLASLYLASYQLDEQDPSASLQTLQDLKGISQLHLLLVKLHQHQNQPTEALAKAKESFPLLQNHPQEAEELTRHIITHYPQDYDTYQILAALIKDPQEKSHVLLQCASQALQDNKILLVKTLGQEAQAIYPSSFLDRRLHLNDFSLEDLTLSYKNHPKELLKAQKLLLLQHIQHQQWLKAEILALDILTKTSKKMPFYQHLENIYNHHTSPKLPQVLKTVAQAYQETQKHPQAERIYKKLYNLDPNYDKGIDLASCLAIQNKTAEAVRTYYETVAFALLDQNHQHLTRCTQEIKAIDPTLKHLTLSERLQLLTQTQCLELSEKVRVLEQQLAQIQRALPPAIPEMAFGKAKWETYFGEIGEEPPLPPDISTILASPCLIWPGKTLQETHMLVLLPKTVNGVPLTLNSLEELIKKPKQGSPTEYTYYLDEAKQQLGEQSLPQSSWVLMTKDVLPESKSKSYADQCKLVEICSQKTKIPYEVPSTLAAAIAILVEHVQNGTILYSENSWTWTHCQEKVAGYQMAVGGFSSSGLYVDSYVDVDDYVGVSALRKF